MFLAVDIGNTNIKLGLWDRTGWSVMQRVPAAPTPDFTAMLAGFAGQAQAAAVTSVVPALAAQIIPALRCVLRIDPLLITPQLKTGVRIALDQPQQVGTDRLLNAAAAYELVGGPVIVVDWGTATKFDVVEAGGVYRGGAIAPGIGITREALRTEVALLHDVQVEVAPPPTPIGTNTAAAIQAGLFWGHVALAERLVARLKAALPAGSMTVIATGGDAPHIAPYVQGVDTTIPTLTLDGARQVYALNQSISL